MSERKRSANWLINEKTLLVDLVTDHFSIVENKKTDGVTMKQKSAEWVKISDEFNSQNTGVHRTADNLKSQWESLKKNTKKVAASSRQSFLQTGGGPANPKNEDPIHTKIISLIKPSAVGIFNPFDSDSTAPEITESNSLAAAQVILLEEPALSSIKDMETDIDDFQKTEVDEASVEIIQDWNDYTPKLLKTPVSKPLQFNKKDQEKLKKAHISKRRPTHAASSPSPQKLHEKKIESTDFQKSVAEKETKLLNEAHELDIQIKKEQLKQEKLKTRLLLLDLKLKRKQLLTEQ